MKRFSIRVLSLMLLIFTAGGVAAQNRVTVTGTITSAEDSMPLIGVSIISGPASGTTSSLDGKYSISVDEGTTLIYQYLGYQAVEWSVPSGITEITHDVALSPDNQTLDEVVVVAYGVRKKGTIAGSVSTVKSDKLESVPSGRLRPSVARTEPRTYGAIQLGRAKQGCHIPDSRYQLDKFGYCPTIHPRWRTYFEFRL